MAETKKKKPVGNANVANRVLPNNLEAEQAVLCCALIDNLAAENILSRLTSEDFYSKSHQEIYECMETLYKSNSPIDFVTVVDILGKKELLEKVGGIAYISELSTFMPSSAHYNFYANIVKRDSTLRLLIGACSLIIGKAYDEEASELLAEAEKLIYDIGEKGTVGGLDKLAQSFNDAMETFEEINKNGVNKNGLNTGFMALDRKLGGLQKTDLIILAARPGIGKTTLAMNIVANAAVESNAKCAIFSLEMGREQLAQRMLCSLAGVSMTKARNGNLNETEWAKLWKAQKKLVESNIYCDDNSLNKPSQILTKCRKLKRESGLDLIVVDYLQLMSGDTKSDNRQNEVSELSRNMKILAKEINVPVIVLSQLSRAVQQRQDHKPVLSDLRESGAIEQDADIVIFIDRRDPSPETEALSKNFVAELNVAKFRNGEPGSVNVGWDGERVRFVNLASDENQKSLEDAYNNMKGNNITPTADVADIFEDIPISELPPDFLGNMPPVEDIFDN